MRNMQAVQRELTRSDAAFRASVAEASGLGKGMSGTSAQLEHFEAQLATQEKALKLWSDRIVELSQKHAVAGEAVERLTPQVEAAKKAWEHSAQELKVAEIALGENAEETDTLREGTARLRSEYNSLAGQLDVARRGIDSSYASLQKAEIGYLNTREQVANLQKEIKNLNESNLTDLVDNITKAGKKLSEIGKDINTHISDPLLKLGKDMVSAAANYESAFTGIRKTVDATEEEYAQLSAEILAMSGTLPFAAAQISKVGEAAGQIGIKAPELMNFSRTTAAPPCSPIRRSPARRGLRRAAARRRRAGIAA
jgi:chromosome segregation ATPase